MSGIERSMPIHQAIALAGSRDQIDNTAEARRAPCSKPTDSGTSGVVASAYGEAPRYKIHYDRHDIAGVVQNDTPCESLLPLLSTGLLRRSVIDIAMASARKNGTTAAEELVVDGLVSHEFHAMCVGRATAARYVRADDVKRVHVNRSELSVQLQPNGLRSCRLSTDEVALVAVLRPGLTRRFIDVMRRAAQSGSLTVMSAPAFRAAFLKEHANDLCRQAADRLFLSKPGASARAGADFRQGAILTMFAGFVAFAFASEPTIAALIMHIMISLFFIICVMLRLAASMHVPAAPSKPVSTSAHHDKPVYSVMVTLLHEEDVVPGLIHHLSRLEWPRSKIEIKLICESDDHGTLAAIEAAQPDERVEVIRVPNVGPRTKPKALCYALPFTTGQLVTLYDAEDRPHPLQLEEAWQIFRSQGERLACVQAPLMIANAHRSVFSALFHMEYAGLFRRILPWLAARDCPLPLGGTSNHFRRNALISVGGWDPYNVTEDADLGYRLWTAGYRATTATLPTLEDAPEQFGVWLPQRTRWFKGWMQTWLVHTRSNRAMLARGGILRFLITHIVMTGVLVSSMLHPLMLLNLLWLGWWLAVTPPADASIVLLAAVDWITILLSYTAFAVIGWKATERPIRRRIRHRMIFIPVYWIAMSIAAWRALGQMFTRPFYWEKTPHNAYTIVQPQK